LSDELERNVFSGNSIWGVLLFSVGTTDNVIAGNFIGTDATGHGPLGNGFEGVYLTFGASSNQIGTNGDGVGDAAEANVIAFNGANGVRVANVGTAGNSIRGNSIHSNVLLGIDLNPGNVNDGVTPNDPGDTDTGGNELQNFPVLHNAVSIAPMGTAVAGQLQSRPGTTYVIDFYASAAADASGFGEGERFLGSLTVTTNPAGIANFAGLLPAATTAGEVLTATATDPVGNTSEFSAAVLVEGPSGDDQADLPVLFAITADRDLALQQADSDGELIAIIPAAPHNVLAPADNVEAGDDGEWTLVEAPVEAEPESDPDSLDLVFAHLEGLGDVMS
ncbi:MAG TPA: hypothetical protein VML55_05745, partial [Planctomycetaceae bacterium]|nr:hypothetical protein [Planctomycetaceae bacterium]